MELDHLFICVEPSAPETEVLQQFGLTEGSANQHLGQGTANRRFFFQNTFIELLYLVNPADAQSELTKPTMLHDRLISRTIEASPFGLCFRPSVATPLTESTKSVADFPCWSYKPKYLPQPLQVQVGIAPLIEPMWFFLNFAIRPDNASLDRQQPMVHQSGFKQITAVRITIANVNDFSEPALKVSLLGGVEIITGASHLLELGFDNQHAKQSFDFRPTLPLIFRW